MTKSTRDPKRRPTHPGELLREDVLPAMGLSQTEFADRLGVSRVSVSQLLHEHRSLSAEMAVKLERVLGTNAEMWLGMQQAVDLWEARMAMTRPNVFISAATVDTAALEATAAAAKRLVDAIFHTSVASDLLALEAQATALSSIEAANQVIFEAKASALKTMYPSQDAA